MSGHAIVLDANILIRAALGRRVNDLILDNLSVINFFAPVVAYEDARKYIPSLYRKRGNSSATALAILARVLVHVRLFGPDRYQKLERRALLRIAQRDADDWHVIACAMLLRCPIWTEDRDFFGCGIATWTTDRVAVYFDGPP